MCGCLVHCSGRGYLPSTSLPNWYRKKCPCSTAQIFHEAKLSLKTPVSPGYHKVKPLDKEGFGWEPLCLTSFDLPSADDRMSGRGEPPPLPNGHPTLGMMGPVLLTSVCTGRGPPPWQHSSSLHSSSFTPFFQNLIHALKVFGGKGGMLHPGLERSAHTHGGPL